MARRKNAAEVGPLGVWAYDTRDLLDLSVEEVIAALPTTYHPATLRKVEGGSARPGTRMWRELGRFYAEQAAAKGIDLEPQPRLVQEEAAPPAGEAAVVAAAIERAIGEQTEVFRELLGELRAFRLQQMEFVRTIAEARLPGEPLEPSGDPEPALRGPVPMPAQTR